MSDADEMRELLTYANYRKVGDALGVSKTAVSQWSRGKDVTPFRVRQVRDLLRPETRRSAAPSMTRRLLAGIMALESAAKLTDADLARAMKAAEAFEALALEADARLAEQLAQSQHTPDAPTGGLNGAPTGGSLGSKRRTP